MDTKVLIAWLESEGSFSLLFNRHNPLNPTLHIQIAQKDKRVLSRMRRELGFGEFHPTSKIHALWFRNIDDVHKLIEILDSEPEECWFSPEKLKQYKACKEYRNFIKLREKRRWTRPEVEYLLKLRAIISPNHEITDKEVMDYFEKRESQTHINKLMRIKNNLIQMRKNKWRVKDIAKHYDVNTVTIYSWFKKLGIPVRKFKKRIN